MVDVTPRYRPNMEKVREQARKAMGGSNFFKAEQGKNVIRILPSWDPEGVLFHADQVIHFGFESDGRQKTILCSAAMLGEKCAVCELRKWLDDQPGMSEIAKKMGTRMKVYFNIVDRRDGACKVWNTGVEKRDLIFSYLETTGYEDLLHPEIGRDCILERTGSGIETRYPTLIPVGSPSPVGLDWEKEVVNLQKKFVDDEIMSYEEQIKLISDNYGGKFNLKEVF